MFLVTGCAHSGTAYTARLLCELGLDVGHERGGKNGVVAWELAATGAPWMLDPELDAATGRYDVVLHQVRHPLRVITTAQFIHSHPHPVWPYIAAHVALGEREPPLRRAMKFYVLWNELAARRGCWRFKIEDVDDAFDEICARIGAASDTSALARVPRDTNSHRQGKPQLTWGDLRGCDRRWCGRVEALAEEYGYDAQPT